MTAAPLITLAEQVNSAGGASLFGSYISSAVRSVEILQGFDAIL